MSEENRRIEIRLKFVCYWNFDNEEMESRN